jgi:hypothetical protein
MTANCIFNDQNDCFLVRLPTQEANACPKNVTSTFLLSQRPNLIIETKLINKMQIQDNSIVFPQ